MWDVEERSQKRRAGAHPILSSWVIPAVILVGLMAWTGIHALLVDATPTTTISSGR